MAEQPVTVSTSRLQLIHKVAILVVLHSIHELKLHSNINFTSWFRCELFPFHFNKSVKKLLQCSRSICMNAILQWYFSFLVELCYCKFWEKERLGCANNCVQINNLAPCKQYHYILLIAYGSDNRRKFPSIIEWTICSQLTGNFQECGWDYNLITTTDLGFLSWLGQKRGSQHCAKRRTPEEESSSYNLMGCQEPSGCRRTRKCMR